jgi:hypothetical protein
MSQAMKTSTKTVPPGYSHHKLGANHRETAHRIRRRDANFSQSQDIWEDRGERQAKQLFASRRDGR